MNTLEAGFARSNITPPRGLPIPGYFVKRNVKGVLDELEINALALRCGDSAAVIVSLDLLNGGSTEYMTECRIAAAETAGINPDAVFIHSTHTHTGAAVDPNDFPGFAGIVKDYADFLKKRICDTVCAAFEDAKPARMGYAVGKAPNISFVRRFRMKDGSVRTNPGVNNPDILAPIGDIDDRIGVLRFDREGAPSIALSNLGCHPDVVGGELVSADWPGFTRRTFEKAVDNVKCIFLNGAEGDVNHVNVHPTPGDFNDLFVDFDDVSRGYGHSRHMGRVVAGGMLQVWDKVTYTDVDSINFCMKSIDIPSNMPAPEQIPEAHRIYDLHKSGRDCDIPYTGMMLTTVVAEARRMVVLEHGPKSFTMPFSALSIGNIALFGVPGEPFNGIGRGIKESTEWDLVLPCCLTNGDEGYFPMRDSYTEGGYEARSSRYKAGTAEIIIDEGKKMLESLRK